MLLDRSMSRLRYTQAEALGCHVIALNRALDDWMAMRMDHHEVMFKMAGGKGTFYKKPEPETNWGDRWAHRERMEGRRERAQALLAKWDAESTVKAN